MLFSPQIPLPLEPQRLHGFDDFVAGSNSASLEAIRGVVTQPDTSLFLYGPKGSGKTHLLNAACLAAREHGGTAFYLGLRGLPATATDALQGLEGLSLVCIDDIQEVAGDPAWEEALFHFINRLRAQQGSLILASRERLGSLPLQLPDLASRLAWGLRMELATLGDEDKLRVINSRADAMGFELPGDVAAYLIRRSDRSLAGLLDRLDRLRHAAFAGKRRITVPLARQILDES